KKEAGEVAAEQGAATPTATTETAPATTVATAEESVVAAAVTGDSNDASSVIPSRAANASPVPTEGSRDETSDGTSSEVLSPIFPRCAVAPLSSINPSCGSP